MMIIAVIAIIIHNKIILYYQKRIHSNAMILKMDLEGRN